MKRRAGARLLCGLVGAIVGLSMVVLPAVAQSEKGQENGKRKNSSASEQRSDQAPGKGSGSSGTSTASESDNSANQPAPEGSSTGQPAQGCDQAQEGYEHNYASTCDGRASENGNGNGEAAGQPCMGCVGAADNKDPKGQFPDGSDSNNGYECDGNNGITKGNPAHTTCDVTVLTPPEPPGPPGPPGEPPVIDDEVLPGPPIQPPGPPEVAPPPQVRDRVLGAALLPVTGGGALLQLFGLALGLMGAGTLLRSNPRR